MKKILFVFAIAFAVVACKNDKKETVETPKAESGQVENSTTATNYVWWKGEKVVGGGHNGKIFFEKIDLQTEDNKLVGGELVVDMSTMTCEDLEGEDAQKLVGHLSNSDFFEVETYPTATFKILEVKHPADGGSDGHQITGSLTIKDVTKNITVPAKIAAKGDHVKLESEFTIDRSEFNVAFKSPTLTDVVKEKAIKDEIQLKVVVGK